MNTTCVAVYSALLHTAKEDALFKNGLVPHATCLHGAIIEILAIKNTIVLLKFKQLGSILLPTIYVKIHFQKWQESAV